MKVGFLLLLLFFNPFCLSIIAIFTKFLLQKLNVVKWKSWNSDGIWFWSLWMHFYIRWLHLHIFTIRWLHLYIYLHAAIVNAIGTQTGMVHFKWCFVLHLCMDWFCGFALGWEGETEMCICLWQSLVMSLEVTLHRWQDVRIQLLN